EGIGIADQPAGTMVDGAVVVQFGRVPAFGRDLVDPVAAVEQQVPQRGGIVRLREAAVQPHDRDVGHLSCSSWTTSVSSPFRNAARIDARCTFPLVVRWIPARSMNTTAGAGTSKARATAPLTAVASSSELVSPSS